MPININAGAPGNPLDALLAQNGGSLWGTTGFNIEQMLANARSGTIDPRLEAMGYHRTAYDDTYQFDPTDKNVSGTTGDITIDGVEYHQLASTSIGGQGQPIDPSKVIYNKQYGLLTPKSNLKPISTGYGDMVFGIAALGLGLPTAMAAMGGTGAAGPSGAAGGTPGMIAPGMEGQAELESQLLNQGIMPGSSAWDSALTSAGFDPSLPPGGTTPYNPATAPPGTPDPTAPPPGGTGPGSSLPPGTQPPAPVSSGATPIPGANPAGTGSWVDNLLNAIKNNPLQALQSGGSLLSLLNQFFGKGPGTASGLADALKKAQDQADPFAQYRPQFAKFLADNWQQLLDPDPAKILASPDAQNEMRLAAGAASQNFAAQGLLRSGARMTGVSQAVEQTAHGYVNDFRTAGLNEANFLAMLSGANVNPAVAAEIGLQGFKDQSTLQNTSLGNLFSNNGPLSQFLSAINTGSFNSTNSTGGSKSLQTSLAPGSAGNPTASTAKPLVNTTLSG